MLASGLDPDSPSAATKPKAATHCTESTKPNPKFDVTESELVPVSSAEVGTALAVPAG